MKILKWVMLLIAIGVVAGGGWVFYQLRQHPLQVFASIGKNSLVKGGLARSDMEGPGGRVALWKGGEGPLLVFVHGGNDSAGTWGNVAPAFRESHRVVVMDLPGHGESEPLEGSLGMELLLSTLSVVIDEHAGGEPATVVGNSLGAFTSMALAARDASRFERVVAVNGGAITGDAEKGALLFPSTREEAAALVALLRDPESEAIPDFVLDDIVNQAKEGPMARLMRDLSGISANLYDGRLDQIAAPVDLLWGASDQLMPVDYAERMLEGLPAARLTTIEKCGHVPQTECPESFLESLRSVLAQEAPGA